MGGGDLTSQSFILSFYLFYLEFFYKSFRFLILTPPFFWGGGWGKGGREWWVTKKKRGGGFFFFPFVDWYDFFFADPCVPPPSPLQGRRFGIWSYRQCADWLKWIDMCVCFYVDLCPCARNAKKKKKEKVFLVLHQDESLFWYQIFLWSSIPCLGLSLSCVAKIQALTSLLIHLLTEGLARWKSMGLIKQTDHKTSSPFQIPFL